MSRPTLKRKQILEYIFLQIVVVDFILQPLEPMTLQTKKSMHPIVHVWPQIESGADPPDITQPF